MDNTCGMRAELTLGGPYGCRQVTLRNVTEVHYNYPAFPGTDPTGRVAFESDVHATGIVYPIKHVLEFEVVPETEIAEEF